MCARPGCQGVVAGGSSGSGDPSEPPLSGEPLPLEPDPDPLPDPLGAGRSPDGLLVPEPSEPLPSGLLSASRLT
jgi:hypothetical protein